MCSSDLDADYACRNRDQALAFLRRPERRPPVGLVDVIDAGEKVVVIVQPAADDDGPAKQTANVTTFRDGKVVEMVHYEHPQEALAAAGVERPEA